MGLVIFEFHKNINNRLMSVGTKKTGEKDSGRGAIRQGEKIQTRALSPRNQGPGTTRLAEEETQKKGGCLKSFSKKRGKKKREITNGGRSISPDGVGKRGGGRKLLRTTPKLLCLITANWKNKEKEMTRRGGGGGRKPVSWGGKGGGWGGTHSIAAGKIVMLYETCEIGLEGKGTWLGKTVVIIDFPKDGKCRKTARGAEGCALLLSVHCESPPKRNKRILGGRVKRGGIGKRGAETNYCTNGARVKGINHISQEREHKDNQKTQESV